MASSSQRMVHQDYIARIRYSNALPPPPNPPKLLDKPNTGLASGQYTAPGFASRLAREQPLNIEADAELGMPLDLVGMPGIFDGDESSIQAPLQTPPVHPHDKALLRPLATLGKPKFNDSGVSFLRRTEYISSHTGKSRFESTTSRSLINNTGHRMRKPVSNVDKESPEAIKAEVERSFEIAAQNLKNSSIIRHPTKRNLKLVDSYPLLPDHNSVTDVGGYATVKFLTNPVPPSSTYDQRVECGILAPMDALASEEAAKEEARELHAKDPEHYPAVPDIPEFEFFMAVDQKTATNYKRKFDTLDPECDSKELYTHEQADGQGAFRFERVRGYECASYQAGFDDQFEDEVALAFTEERDGTQKAAHYYSIVQRVVVRPQRRRNIANKRWAQDTSTQDEDLERQTDIIDLQVAEADEVYRTKREHYKTDPFYTAVEVGESSPAPGGAEIAAGLLTPEEDADED